MTNYVSINNTILRDIVRCFNSQYIDHASCTRELVWYLTKKTHCFQRYNQTYRKTGTN